jgi:UDP-N-acetylglucosamine--N-acetylmuramyl-(pentapeptide) pyrophosphoryl-undecaprenol N-acetylglucosamine transferase
MESPIFAGKGFSFRLLSAAGFAGKGFSRKAVSLMKLSVGLLQSARILREFRPDLVVGMGGYVAFPLVLAAFCMGFQTVIHEQNFVPGMTNRLLARLVTKIFVSFEQSRHHFPAAKTKVTGSPVRKELMESSPRQESERREFTLLIIGGSQGSHQINAAVLSALDYLHDHRHRLFFIHQTGDKDLSWAQQTYSEKGFKAEVRPFIEDMRRAYDASRLVICRAGAATLAELTCLGKASILIPYPFSTASHQELNALALAHQQAAEIIYSEDLNATVLSQRMVHYLENPNKIDAMEHRAGHLGRPQATGEIVDACLELLSARGVHV